MEIWKEVKGYEGLYKVSNLGNIKSLPKKGNPKGKILKPCLTGIGRDYLGVCLFKDKKGKTRTIHQLVAEAFLNHTPNGHELVVDHINNVKTDNRLENLQLITARRNSSKDRKGGSSKYTGVSWSKLNKNWLAQIQINGKIKGLGYFKNEEEAAKAYQNALAKLVN
tara:strand:+ start:71 stop:568 length:498 start_codon:yes stop_codon:yes gene_type:complete